MIKMTRKENEFLELNQQIAFLTNKLKEIKEGKYRSIWISIDDMHNNVDIYLHNLIMFKNASMCKFDLREILNKSDTNIVSHLLNEFEIEKK
jgi:hypothetical protein